MGLNIADLAITAAEFGPGERIPAGLSYDGGNAEPTFTVTGVPEGAVELAVVVHDPDAPLPRGFTHWVRYGLPAHDGPIDPATGVTGPNTAGQEGWYGPQPPAGHGDHHYYAWVYALSREVTGNPTYETFLEQYADAILEQNRVVGVYST